MRIGRGRVGGVIFLSDLNRHTSFFTVREACRKSGDADGPRHSWCRRHRARSWKLKYADGRWHRRTTGRARVDRHREPSRRRKAGNPWADFRRHRGGAYPRWSRSFPAHATELADAKPALGVEQLTRILRASEGEGFPITQRAADISKKQRFNASQNHQEVVS